MIRILIVDDQPAVREGLRMRLALEPDLLVVGEAGTGDEALDAAALLIPDVVVMDIEMPQIDGITAARRLHETSPEAGVVMLSIHGDAGTRLQACAAGAAGFVEKRGGDERLLAAIRQAAVRGACSRAEGQTQSSGGSGGDV